jgi:GPH family glycoside/pentoside/hexuronide:cation symporter
VGGALASALIFALLWQIHSGFSQRFYFWFFLVGTNLFYIAYTVYATPFIALGYEMTPDYNERVRIQSYGNVIGQIPWLILPWSYAFMENKRFFATNVEGARGLAVLVGIAVAVFGVLPGLFCKEPFYAISQLAYGKKKGTASGFWRGLRHHLAEFTKGFAITLRNRRFLMLAAATFLVFGGFMMISGLGPYVIMFYVFGGDQKAGAQYVGWFGMVLSACTFGAIMAVGWLATKFEKRHAFIISTSIAIAGYVLKWFCYRPGSPVWLFLPAPLLAFGLGGLFITVSSMIADVCDQDELDVGVRREGTFGAIYWWMVNLGTAAALAASGHLLNATGFLQEMGANQSEKTLFLMRLFETGVPIVAYALAIAAIFTYDLDEKKVRAIRVQLEARRGKVSA